MSKQMTVDELRNFPGSGKAKCFVCGDSVINHDIGPCPTLVDNVVHISDRRRFGENYRDGGSK